MQLFLPKSDYTSDDEIKFNNKIEDFFRNETITNISRKRLELLSQVLTDLFGNEWSFFRDVGAKNQGFCILVRYKDLVIKNDIELQHNSRNVFLCLVFEILTNKEVSFTNRISLQKTTYTNEEIDKHFIHPHCERCNIEDIAYGFIGKRFCFGSSNIGVKLGEAFESNPENAEQYKNALFKLLLEINHALHREDLEGTAYVNLEELKRTNHQSFTQWDLFTLDFSYWLVEKQKTLSFSVVNSRSVVVSDEEELKTLMKQFVEEHVSDPDYNYLKSFINNGASYDIKAVETRKKTILESRKDYCLPYFYFNNEKVSLEFLDNSAEKVETEIVISNNAAQAVATRCEAITTKCLYNVLYHKKHTTY